MNLLMIAKGNMKKKKSSMVLILLLVTISTMLLYTGVNVITNVDGFLDNRNEEQNGSDFFLVCNEGYDEEIQNILKGVEGYDYSERENTIALISSSIKNVSKNLDKENFSFLTFDIKGERSISDLEFLQTNGEMKENSIVIPAYFNISKGYEVGDTIEIQNGDKSYAFEIYGFSEDIMFSTPSNVTVFEIFINKDIQNKIRSEDSSTLPQSCFKVKLKDGYATKEYEDRVTTDISNKITDRKFKTNVVLNYDIMKMGTMIFTNIMMGIISIFSIIVVIISMIVIRFSIKTSIESNMQNIGVLEALGYTSKQLKIATVLEYLIVSVIGAVLGLLVSTLSSRIIATIVSSAIGLSWNISFDVRIAALSIIVVILSVLLVTLISSASFKKINPLIALRNGINNHNFKINPMPLSKSKLGLNTTIGLKEMLHNKKQNISMAIIIMLLSFTSIVAIGIYYNFGINQDSLMDIIGLEKPDILISSPDCYGAGGNSNIYKVFDEIEDRDDVDNTLFYSTEKAKLTSGDKSLSLDLNIVSEFENIKILTIVEGRVPKHDNEIIVTSKVLEGLDAKIGDTIYVEALGEKEDFIIVGVSQQIPQMGYSAKVTEEGINRIIDSYKGSSLYVYLKDGESTQKVVDKLKDEYKDINLSIVNFENTYNTVLSTFNGGVAILSIVCSAVTVVVIVLILFMLIKMKLLKDRRILGVYKAIGYTTRQLMWQTTMNFAPVISIGALLGIILGKIFVNPVFALCLSFSGIKKCYLNINLGILLITFVSITALAFAISMFYARKVKNIEAYKMIVE